MKISQTAREAGERITRMANDPRLATLSMRSAAEIIQSAMDAEATAQREANYALCRTNQTLGLALVRMEEQRDAARAELAQALRQWKMYADERRGQHHELGDGNDLEDQRYKAGLAAIDAAREKSAP